MESDYLVESAPLDDPTVAGLGTYEINRELFMQMLRSAIDAKSDFNPQIFHQKFIVRDNRSVLTGSTNFTTTGTTKNLNHVLIVHDEKIARAYAAEFSDIKKGFFGKYIFDRDRKPVEEPVSGVRVKPLFAPDHMPEMEFIKQMNKARERIDFAIFTFSESSGIDDALVIAHRLGVAVNGILDRKQANQKWSAKWTLMAGGIRLMQIRRRAGVGKLHHKLMTIDDEVTIIGSFNYTGPANMTNDENIVVIGDLDERDPDARARQRQIATFARQEIDRIRQEHGEWIPVSRGLPDW